MATDIKIQNYQSIGKASFSVKGFTVIVGKNNIGKSAIIRAITAALTNQLGGDFIRLGTKECQIGIQGHGIDLEWKRGATTTYKVNGGSYSKLRGSVPQPILDAGFKQVKLGDLTLNPLVAEQFKEVFLIDKHGGKVAEAISAMYELDILSKADDLCQKQLNNLKRTAKIRKIDQEKLNNQLDKYKGFEELQEKIEELEKLENKCLSLESEISDIHLLESRLEILLTSLRRLEKITDIEVPDYKATEQLKEEYIWLDIKIASIYELTKSVKSLQSITRVQLPTLDEAIASLQEIGIIDDLQNRFDSIEKMIQRLKPGTKIEIPSIGSLETALEESKGLLEMDRNFRNLIQETRVSRDFLEQINKKLEELEKQKSEIDRCPLCERPF